MPTPFPSTLLSKLKQAQEKHLFRSLKNNYPQIDFSSNDYLGFSTQGFLLDAITNYSPSVKFGSSGSRLISGNSCLFNEVESDIAKFHSAEDALIFNSGYDANIGLLSSVPQKGDLIISDELIHASLIDGIRLSFATHYKFKHNDLNSLTELVERHRSKFNQIYLVVESVYSMDGDTAPLIELLELCKNYRMHLIVDEAHAIGVFGYQGRGLCEQFNIENDCFARVYTFGKAMGCHGAAIVGSKYLKQYLINFSRSFIFTTAMPEHSLLGIKAAYELLQSTQQTELLKENITYFNSRLKTGHHFIHSSSAIHCRILPGNKSVEDTEEKLALQNLFVKSIKSPTVKEGEERMRVCLHSYNTKSEIDLLLEYLN